jgi:hypothetical protein
MRMISQVVGPAPSRRVLEPFDLGSLASHLWPEHVLAVTQVFSAMPHAGASRPVEVMNRGMRWRLPTLWACF